MKIAAACSAASRSSFAKTRFSRVLRYAAGRAAGLRELHRGELIVPSALAETRSRRTTRGTADSHCTAHRGNLLVAYETATQKRRRFARTGGRYAIRRCASKCIPRVHGCWSAVCAAARAACVSAFGVVGWLRDSARPMGWCTTAPLVRRGVRPAAYWIVGRRSLWH
jgi:hypothetical protein